MVYTINLLFDNFISLANLLKILIAAFFGEEPIHEVLQLTIEVEEGTN